MKANPNSHKPGHLNNKGALTLVQTAQGKQNMGKGNRLRHVLLKMQTPVLGWKGKV